MVKTQGAAPPLEDVTMPAIYGSWNTYEEKGEKAMRPVRPLNGFTLIEIISVLVILGILAAVAIPKYYDLQERAHIQSALVAVQEAQARINLLFAQQVLQGNLPDCSKFTVSTINGSSHVGSNYAFSITDGDLKEQGPVGSWRIYLENGCKNDSKRRRDYVNALIPPEDTWYVTSGKGNNLVPTGGKTAYTIPQNMRELFTLSLPACE